MTSFQREKKRKKKELKMTKDLSMIVKHWPAAGLSNAWRGFIRNCDNNVRKKGIELFSNHNIFDEKETCNKFFLHNEGVIYKSPVLAMASVMLMN